MRTRKKEVEALIATLEQEHASVEDLADTIWKQIDEYRTVREAWVIAVNHGSNIVITYGLYDTENAALKDLAKYRSTTGNEVAYVLKLFSPSALWGGDKLDWK